MHCRDHSSDAIWHASDAHASPSCRHEALPWSTHAELARVKNDDDRRELLDRAAEERWTKHQARAEVARLKNARAIGAPAAGNGTCTVTIPDFGGKRGILGEGATWAQTPAQTRGFAASHEFRGETGISGKA